MTYCKLIDGQLVLAPRKIINGDITVYNPTGEYLISLGYKPLTIEPEPEVPEGYHLEPIYSDTENAIINDWQIVENPPEEPDPEEILDILLGGEA